MMNMAKALGVGILLVALSSCLPKEEVTLQSVSVTADISPLPKGLTATLNATGHYSDGSSAPCAVVWSTSNASIATVYSDSQDASVGIAMAQTVGLATIMATAADDYSVRGTIEIEVVAPVLESMVVSPNPGQVALGLDFEFEAIGTFSDATVREIDATWSSSDPAVATVDSNGAATGAGLGTATITAVSVADPGKSASATLQVMSAVPVYLTVTPSPASVDKGLTIAFTATAVYSDSTTGTIPVTWSSSDLLVATIDASGTATGAGAGLASITATSTQDAGVYGSASLTVNPASLASIQVSPATATVNISSTASFSALGIYSDQSTAPETVTWTSSDTNVATVDSAGVATGVAPGQATITATSVSSPTIFGTATLDVRTPFDYLYLNCGSSTGDIVRVPYAGGAGSVFLSNYIHQGTPGNMFDPPIFASNIRGVCVHPDGSRIYFMSEYRHVVEYVFATGQTRIVHMPTTLSTQNGWQALAIDSQGYLYTMNPTNQNYGVYRIDLTQNVNANYPGVATQFCTMSLTAPMDLTVYNGDVYVCYWGGVYKGSAGGALSFFYSHSGPSLNVLSSIEVDAATGTFYVADSTASQVYKLRDADSNGWILTGESSLYVDLSGQAAVSISEIALDSLGNLYVAECYGTNPPAQGIWKLTDANADGDMLDSGEGVLWTMTVLGAASGGGNMGMK